MDDLIKTLDSYLVKKAPGLPSNIKEILVKFAPWLIIITTVISLPAVLAFLGFGAMFYALPFAGLAAVGFNYTLAIVFLVISIVLRGLAIPGLFSRSKSGWNMLFYATLVNAVYQLLNVDIVGMIVGALISLYLLFQVRDYYK